MIIVIIAYLFLTLLKKRIFITHLSLREN
jgi:hypothetical protein